MILVYLLNIMHRILVYFMLFGFILPGKHAWLHGIAFPLVYWHWTKNDGNCILTQYEHKLRKMDYMPNGNNMNDYPFLRRIFSDMGLHMTNEDIKKYIIPYFFVISFTSLCRFIIYKSRASNASNVSNASI